MVGDLQPWRRHEAQAPPGVKRKGKGHGHVAEIACRDFREEPRAEKVSQTILIVEASNEPTLRMILVAHPSAEEDCHVMTMMEGFGITLVRLRRECGACGSVQQGGHQ